MDINILEKGNNNYIFVGELRKLFNEHEILSLIDTLGSIEKNEYKVELNSTNNISDYERALFRKHPKETINFSDTTKIKIIPEVIEMIKLKEDVNIVLLPYKEGVEYLNNLYIKKKDEHECLVILNEDDSIYQIIDDPAAVEEYYDIVKR